MSRLHLAFFSPFRPQQSGICEYSEELLPYLRELADVDIVAGSEPLANESLKRDFLVLDVASFLARASKYDCALYQLGNNLHHHGYMVPCMRQMPGIAVVHDYCLQFLMLGLTLRAGHIKELEDHLAPIYPDTCRDLARKLLTGGMIGDELSFAGLLIRMSRAVVVHSEYARNRILHDLPETNVRVIRMGVPINPTADREELRRRYGFSTKDFILASISTACTTKRLELVLQALSEIRKTHKQTHLVVVGGGRLGSDYYRLISKLQLGDAITERGWVWGDEYRHYMQLADVIVDIRYPSGAETSASLSRALSYGTPAILSDQGSFSELPSTCCIKLAVDGKEIFSLRDAVLGLIQNPSRRLQLSRGAREYSEAELRLSDMAHRYVAFAEEVASRPPMQPIGLADPEPLLSRVINANLFKLARVRHLLRAYGVRETLRRVQEEISAESGPRRARPAAQ